MALKEIQAIVFDFDGVLVESVSVKGQAFVALYADESEEIRGQVLEHHTENGGVSRYDKIRHYETVFCGRTVDEEGVQKLAAKFSDIVEDMVVQAAWVPGALDFIKKYHGNVPFYIASATPQDELRRITEKRKISQYFNDILGSPKKKGEHLADVITRENYEPAKVVMIGDAITDYNAAQAASTQFIGRKLPDQDAPFPEGTRLIDDLSQLAIALGLRA